MTVAGSRRTPCDGLVGDGNPRALVKVAQSGEGESGDVFGDALGNALGNTLNDERNGARNDRTA